MGVHLQCEKQMTEDILCIPNSTTNCDCKRDLHRQNEEANDETDDETNDYNDDMPRKKKAALGVRSDLQTKNEVSKLTDPVVQVRFDEMLQEMLKGDGVLFLKHEQPIVVPATRNQRLLKGGNKGNIENG